MMYHKVVLIFGIIILSITVMPNILAKFQGQHYFIAPQNVQCTKCHADVAQELQQSEIIGHIQQGCRGCHVAIPDIQNYEFHAAALVECLACHGGVSSEFNEVVEAHRPFFIAANETFNTMSGANEACIACHTHGGKAELTEPKNYTVYANFTCDNPSDITTCKWIFKVGIK